MRRVQLMDFCASAQEEIEGVLVNDDVVVGVEECGQLRVVVVSAKKYGDLIAKQAGLEALCRELAGKR